MSGNVHPETFVTREFCCGYRNSPPNDVSELSTKYLKIRMSVPLRRITHTLSGIVNGYYANNHNSVLSPPLKVKDIKEANPLA